MSDDPTYDSEDPPLTPLEHPAEAMTGDIPVPPMAESGEIIAGSKRSSDRHIDEVARAWRDLASLKENL